MEQRAVFFDIDGTLYDRENPVGIPESTREAVRRMQKKGVLAFICTGRTRAELEELFLEFGFDGMICGCGTYIEYMGKVLHYRNLKPQIVGKLVEITKKYGATAILEGLHQVQISEQEYAVSEGFREALGGMLCGIGDRPWDDIQKFTIRNGSLSDEQKNRMFEEMSPFVDFIIHGIDAECIPHGYSKAKGIEILLSFLGIDRKNTYAFGDSLNDKEMLAYVEYGIAMGNAREEILKQCRYRTTPLYEDGIYKACEALQLI